MNNNNSLSIRDLAPNSEWVDVMDELNEANVDQQVVLALINEKGDYDPENATGLIPDDADWKTIANCLALRYLLDFAPDCTNVIMKPKRGSDGSPSMEAIACKGIVGRVQTFEPAEGCITKQLGKKGSKE